MSSIHDTGYAGKNVNADNLNKTSMFLLGALPGSNYPVGAKVILTTDKIIYENTGSFATPVWTARSYLGGQAYDVCIKLSTIIGDYSTPAAATATSEVGGITHTVVGTFLNTPSSLENAIDYNAATATSGDTYNATAKQLSHTGRHKFDFITALVNPQQLRIKIGLWASASAGANAYLDYSNDGINWTQDQLIASNTATAEQVYDSAITPNNYARYYAIRLTYANDTNVGFLKIYSMHIEGATGRLATHAFDGNLATWWESLVQTGPHIFFDFTSARDHVSIALALHTTTITGFTHIKIRISTDSTFTDGETVRYIPVSDFTNDTYRFILINRLAANARYIQIYGDGTGVLAVSDIKSRYTSLTDTLILRDHFHRKLKTLSIESGVDSN